MTYMKVETKTTSSMGFLINKMKSSKDNVTKSKAVKIQSDVLRAYIEKVELKPLSQAQIDESRIGAYKPIY